MKNKTKLIKLSLLLAMLQSCGAPFPTYDYSYPDYSYSSYNHDEYCPEEPVPTESPVASPTAQPVQSPNPEYNYLTEENHEQLIETREEYQKKDEYIEESYEEAQELIEEPSNIMRDQYLEYEETEKNRRFVQVKKPKSRYRKMPPRNATPNRSSRPEVNKELSSRNEQDVFVCSKELILDRNGDEHQQIVCEPFSQEAFFPNP